MGNNSLGKNSLNLGGFTYPEVKSPIDKPDGAIITDGFIQDNSIAGSQFRWVPYSEFLQMVGQGLVKGMKLDKNGEPLLRAFRDNMRDPVTGGKNLVGSTALNVGGASVAIAAANGAEKALASGVCHTIAYETVADTVEQAAIDSAISGASVAALSEVATGTALQVAGSAGSETALQVAGQVGADVVEGELVEVVDVTSKAGSVAIPIAVLVATSLAVGYSAYGIAGAMTKHKVFEYNAVRLLSSHCKHADTNDKIIAVSFVGINKKKGVPHVVCIAYGRGVPAWSAKLQSIPDLPGSIQSTDGNMTLLCLPLDTILTRDISLGYSLLYNTQMLYIDKYTEAMVKKTKVPNTKVAELRNRLEAVSSPMQAPTSPQSSDVNNVQAYCQKYGFTEEQFWSSEAPRLYTILECKRETINACLAPLV